MASLAFIQFSSLPRWHSNWPFFPSTNFVQFVNIRLQRRWNLVAAAASTNNVAGSFAEETSGEQGGVVEKKTRKTINRTKRAPAGRRKKVDSEAPEKNSVSLSDGELSDEVNVLPSESNNDSKKTRKTRRKAASTSNSIGTEETVKKETRRRSKKKVDDSADEGSAAELSDEEVDIFGMHVNDDNEEDLELGEIEADNHSHTYGWPPLVCCFGAAQHAFIPSARPANRLLDYKTRQSKKGAFWAPEKFVRAPGSCSSNVALTLATLGGKVAFMGKLGQDNYGQALLSCLNMYKVETRSIHLDSKRVTAVSHMKIGKRGGLRMTCVKPCAEDSLSRSEINIDVLKEAKMFYFNSSSLLDCNMRSTLLQAIKISKKLGGVIFYDLNLPLPLWQSSEETRKLIEQVWSLSDIIEVTKQELEFLRGIKPFEEFDTKNNNKLKFIHYKPEVISPLWHENLKVLFVTNGTSKVHYYTKEQNGAVLGMEDPPITPFTQDMSASGDGIVAGLMKMLTVQPHLMTDRGYLEHSIKYAINCGVTGQWMQARTYGYPPKEGMEHVAPDLNGIRSVTEREYLTLTPTS